jgi:hypothetical protein
VAIENHGFAAILVEADELGVREVIINFVKSYKFCAPAAVLPCISALLASAGSGAAELSPQDFAFGMPVITQKDAAVYRFPLPLVVYRETVRDDLADLRLFNASGEVVPYSLLRPTPPQSAHTQAVALPLFPLRSGARAVMNGIRLTLESADSAVDLDTRHGDGAALPINQYLLDGRALLASVSALELTWPETAADYSGRVKVEVSDDLDGWRTVVAAAPTANLHANGQVLIENRVLLTPTRARFWRLSWVGPAPAFGLTSVLAEPADSPRDASRASLDVAGIADSTDAGVEMFDLGAHLPVTRVSVLLPEINTVNTIELSSRRSLQDPWRTFAQSGFYRIKTADGEQQNSPLEIALDRDRFWRARIVRGDPPHQGTVRLHVEWVPNEVTFLARGQPPFLLAYGNATATAADSDLSQVPTDTDSAPAVLGAERTLGGQSRIDPRSAPVAWTRGLLWGTLLAAVLLLGWMAYRLVNR